MAYKTAAAAMVPMNRIAGIAGAVSRISCGVRLGLSESQNPANLIQKDGALTLVYSYYDDLLWRRRARPAIKLFEKMALQSRTPHHLDIAAAVFTPCLTPTD